MKGMGKLKGEGREREVFCSLPVGVGVSRIVESAIYLQAETASSLGNYTCPSFRKGDPQSRCSSFF